MDTVIELHTDDASSYDRSYPPLQKFQYKWRNYFHSYVLSKLFQKVSKVPCIIQVLLKFENYTKEQMNIHYNRLGEKSKVNEMAFLRKFSSPRGLSVKTSLKMFKTNVKNDHSTWHALQKSGIQINENASNCNKEHKQVISEPWSSTAKNM